MRNVTVCLVAASTHVRVGPERRRPVHRAVRQRRDRDFKLLLFGVFLDRVRHHLDIVIQARREDGVHGRDRDVQPAAGRVVLRRAFGLVMEWNEPIVRR